MLPEMAILPGQLAFFFVLAIVPTITLITYGAALLNVSTDIIFNFLKNAFSEEIATMLLASTSPELNLNTLFIIIVGYFTASNGPASIILTSNTIYGEEQSSFINRRVKSLIMTLILVILFVFMLLVPVFGDKIIALLRYVEIKESITNQVVTIIKVFQGPINWLIIYFFIKILYTIAPTREVKSKSVGYGAIFTSIGWIIATGLYSFYINHIAHYTTLYGGFANIVILMLWFYLLALVFTIGMALNCRNEEEKLEKTGTIKKVN